MTETDLNKLRNNFLDARKALTEALRYRKAEPVQDYRFSTRGFATPGTAIDQNTFDQSVALSELFLDQSALFVVHNMGISCTYCTLWADGFNGMLQHLSDRAAFVISSPDSVDVQQKFKASREWKFDMVSTTETSFAEDMGYRNAQGYHPGVSIFSKTKNEIHRVADTPFGPGDDFCALWHLFDLLPERSDGWQPKLSYSS